MELDANKTPSVVLDWVSKLGVESASEKSEGFYSLKKVRLINLHLSSRQIAMVDGARGSKVEQIT